MWLIVASLRHLSGVAALTQAGVTIFTLSPTLTPLLFALTLTNVAAEDFERAADAMQPI